MMGKMKDSFLTRTVLLYPRYEVYRGYIVFAFSVTMFVCLSVCLSVNFFSVKYFSYTPRTKYIGGI